MTHLTVLDEAILATSQDRPASYGHPRDHFARTTGMINAAFTEIVRARLAAGQPMFTPGDWPLIMIMDKVARHVHGRKRDCLVDIAGYARTAEMVDEKHE